MDYGSQEMSGKLRRVLMRRPGKSLAKADPAKWHFGETFNPEKAIAQHEAFSQIVAAYGCEITWLDESDSGLADAMFAHDPSFVTEHGAVVLQMGKALREREPKLHELAYRDLDIPILGKLTGNATAEGGDMIWVDRKTLAVGRGARTNQAGIDQLRTILEPHAIEVIDYDLPYGQGPDACLHLMSVVSPLASDLALVFAPMMPFAFRALMEERGIRCLEAPAEEFAASNGLNLNVLPLAPRDVVMVEGFLQTRKLMEGAGCRVQTFEADALCIACEGGPTCLTRPILRESS